MEPGRLSIKVNSPTCESVTPDTFDQAVTTLASAFLDDPTTNYIFGCDVKDESEEKVRKINTFFEVMTRIHMNLKGHVIRNVSEKERVSGRCLQLWLNPSDTIFSSLTSSGFFGFFQFRFIEILRGLEYGIKAGIIEYQHVLHEEKTFHLSVAATHPSFQKQGLLKNVFNPILEAIDEVYGYAYLECTKEENVPLYEHFGFRVVDTFELSVFNFSGRPNIKIWSMLRNPKKKETDD